jgi:hypothetical protein
LVIENLLLVIYMTNGHFSTTNFQSCESPAASVSAVRRDVHAVGHKSKFKLRQETPTTKSGALCQGTPNILQKTIRPLRPFRPFRPFRVPWERHISLLTELELIFGLLTTNISLLTERLNGLELWLTEAGPSLPIAAAGATACGQSRRDRPWRNPPADPPRLRGATQTAL